MDASEDSNSLKNRRISANSSNSTLSDAGRRTSSALRNEEIMKSLAALKEELSEDNQNTKISAPTTANINHSTKTGNNSAMLRMKAETAAEMYLGVDDAGKFLRFLDFYVSLFESKSTNQSIESSDSKIVKAFNLFDGDIKKSTDFLLISAELEELGFEEDKVLSALMLNSNDREAALDFLMKN